MCNMIGMNAQTDNISRKRVQSTRPQTNQNTSQVKSTSNRSNSSGRRTFDIYGSNAVSNVDYKLEGDHVVITYDLNNDSNIYVFASTNATDGWNTSFMNWSAYLSEAPALRAVTGDVGRRVKSGKKKQIIWRYKDETAPFFERSENGITSSFVVYKDGVSHSSDALLASLEIKVESTKPTLEPELIWVDGADGAGNFWISKYPITLAQFADFVNETNYKTDAEKKEVGEVWSITKKSWDKMKGVNWRCDEYGNTRPRADYEKYPVVNVSWRDAMQYCAWLSKKYNRSYSLPSFNEAYDAFSCYPPGSVLTGMRDEIPQRVGGNVNEICWNNSNSGYKIHPIGTKQPNKMGLYDLMGNCNEWGFEYVDPSTNSVVNYKDVVEGKSYAHVGYGGSAFEGLNKFSETVLCWPEDTSGVNIGFRVVMYLGKGQSYK